MIGLQGILNTFLWGAGGVVCTALILLVAFQEKLVYVPVIPGLGKGYPFTPARLRMSFEDVWLRAADGTRLHSWFIRYQLDTDDIAHRLESVDVLMKRLHCNVFLLSYRGYGDSDGTPTQHGIMLDAQAALEHLLGRTDINTKKIVVFGRSLGGAVGAQLVHSNPGKVAGLVLENTFTSILDMAPVMVPPLRLIVGAKGYKLLNPLVRSPWITIRVIDKIQEPILFLSGLLDEMVPPAHMRELYEATTGNPSTYFVEFRTGMHMDTWLRGGESYWRVLQIFLDRHTNELSVGDPTTAERVREDFRRYIS
eukprot:jgi/Mesen1/424/ME000100S10650